MMKLKYSVHLSNLLNVHDIAAINLYLARQPNKGIHILDRHFAIRKKYGLVSFSRIDIYVSLGGMIFLSSVEEDSTSPSFIKRTAALRFATSSRSTSFDKSCQGYAKFWKYSIYEIRHTRASSSSIEERSLFPLGVQKIK